MLNADQQKAALDDHSRVMVSAGAGCGKTRTLVWRYVNILREEDVQVPEIVAITFTIKAANELKERIHARLRELYKAATDKKERLRWKRHLSAVESARISTIHGFCTEVLREFPVQAGVDPGFSIVEETDASELAGEAVEEFLTDAAGAGEQPVRDLFVRFGLDMLRDITKRSLARREDIAHLKETMVDTAGSVEVLAEGLFVAARDYAELESERRLSAENFKNDVAILLAARGPCDDKLEELRATFETAWSENVASDELSSAAFWRSIGAIGKPGNRGSRAAWKEHLKPVRKALSRINYEAERQVKLFDALDVEDWLQRGRDMLAFTDLHRGALERYSALKRSRGVIDFDDAIILVRDLLRRDDEVAQAVAERCRHILVDEFQDTDHVQAEIVDRLAGRGARLFVVGDAEQSIYRFRGAEVEVFTEKQLAMLEGDDEGGCHELRHNYRSLSHVLNCINFLFAGLMCGGGRDRPWHTPHSRLLAQRSSPYKRVEIICAGSQEGMHVARQIEARAVAERIRKICTSGEPLVRGEDGTLRPPVYGDIAVLFRTMSNIEIYERCLAEAAIPYHTVAGRTFYRRKEVRDLINLLAVIADGDDTAALVGALRSPLFAVSDDCLAMLSSNGGIAAAFAGFKPSAHAVGDEAVFGRAVALAGRLRALKNRLPARRIVDMIFEETGYIAALAACFRGRQQVLNAMKVRESAAAFDRAGKGGFEDFVRRLRTFSLAGEREGEAVMEEESQRGAVQIMTVHAAKGLEFPIVIVADMGWTTRGSSERLVIDRRYGMALPKEPDEPEGYRLVLKSMAADRDEAENRRTFYVAATRAQDHLILSGAAAKSVGGWMASALDALEISRESPGEYDYDDFAVVYSTPGESLPAASGAPGAALSAARDEVLAGQLPFGRPTAETSAMQMPVGAGSDWPRRLTATAAADFARCPLLFELSHVRGLPGDRILGERTVGGGERRLAGSILHEVLELAVPGRRLGETLDDVLGARGLQADRCERIRRICLPVLERFEKSPPWQRLREAGGARERDFAFLLNGCVIEGKIDRLLPGEVVDFKSDDIEACEADSRAQTYRTQMDVYALAAERVAGEAPGKVTIVFLRPCIEHSWRYGRAGIERARARMAALLERIRQGPPWRPAETCTFRCDHSHTCSIIAERRTSQQ